MSTPSPVQYSAAGHAALTCGETWMGSPHVPAVVAAAAGLLDEGRVGVLFLLVLVIP
jgi:hypothetical protein